MGQWAARLTCLRIEQFFFDDHPISVSAINQLISEIDWELRGEGRGTAACTLSVLWLHEHEAAIAHVGDSAIYRLRGGDISMMTQIQGSGRSLRAFMGMGPTVSDVCSITCESLLNGDVFFLVTDGVSNLVSPPELATAWTCSNGDPDRCAATILQRVTEQEGSDDATVVVVQFLSDGSRERVLDPTNAPDIPRRLIST
jgi:serine/threonine protein phosphatase PrpC